MKSSPDFSVLTAQNALWAQQVLRSRQDLTAQAGQGSALITAFAGAATRETQAAFQFASALATAAWNQAEQAAAADATSGAELALIAAQRQQAVDQAES